MSAGPSISPTTPSSEELRRAAAARRALAAAREAGAVEDYLARMEAALAARVDERVAQRALEEGNIDSPAPRHGLLSGLTARLSASLALGIPLVAVAGGIGGEYGHSGGAAVSAICAVLVTILGLNIYYTEAEKSLEKERLRRNRRD